MGKGSSTKQNNVVKERAGFSGGEGGGSAEKPGQNECIFSFSDTASLNRNKYGILPEKVSISIVPSASDKSKLELFANGILVGHYFGQYQAKIILCIGQDFIYEGAGSVKHEGTTTTIKYTIGSQWRS